MNAGSASNPPRDDYLVELLHQRLDAADLTALAQWRKHLAEALEAWNLSLARRLLAELARHDLGRLGQAHLRMGRGGLLLKRERWSEAETELQRAERLFAQSPGTGTVSSDDWVGRSWVLLTLGNLYSDRGNWDQALEVYQQAANLYQAQGDAYGEAQVLVNIGSTCYVQTRWGEALQAYRRSLEIFLEVGDMPSAAMSLSGLGHILTELGNYEEAMECYEASLEVFVEDEDVSAQVSTLNNLGRVFDSAAQPERALECYHQSLDLAGKQGDLRSQAIALDNLGVTLGVLERHGEALSAHEQALDIYRDLGDEHSASASLNHLGMAYRRLQQFDNSEARFEEALALKRQLGDRRGLASVLINFTLLRIDQNRWNEIQPLAEEAAQLSRDTQSDEPLATAHALLGLAAVVTRGDVGAGAEHYATAVATAWDYHPVVGGRINRFVLRHLDELLQRGKVTAARSICERVLGSVAERVKAEHPEALSDFETLDLGSQDRAVS